MEIAFNEAKKGFKQNEVPIGAILVKNGKIIADNMKKVKFDLDDLLEICRCNGYFDINQIEM